MSLMSVARTVPRLPWALLALLLVAGTLAGCASSGGLGKQKRANTLEDAVENYRKLIRWAYFDEAVRYLRSPDGDPPPTDLERVARYRVTSYEISRTLMADTGKEARVNAVIEYYEIDAGIVHKLRDDQLWWFDDKDERWYLASGLPAFGMGPP